MKQFPPERQPPGGSQKPWPKPRVHGEYWWSWVVLAAWALAIAAVVAGIVVVVHWAWLHFTARLTTLP